jgi:aspartate/methionine/tyrosine aminotransferase
MLGRVSVQLVYRPMDVDITGQVSTPATGEVGFDGLERWFAAAGAPPRLDLARSGAPPISTADLLALGPPETTEAYLQLPLDYGPGEGTPRLREAVASTGAARSADQVLITHGAIEALLLVTAAKRGTVRRMAVATPAYDGMIRAPEAAGAEIVPVPIWRSGALALDLSGFDDRLIQGCSAVLVNLPHNPTGLVADRNELADLAERCLRLGTLLVVDEVAQGTLDPRSTSLARTAAFERGGVAVIGDVSKSLGLGGLRIGWLCCADRHLRSRVIAIKDHTSLGNAPPSQFLATLALERRAQLGVGALAARNLASLTRWLDLIPNSSLVRPVDGLVAFPSLPLGAPSVAVAAHLRAKVEVSVLPGSLFGIEGHFRLSLGQAPDDFDEALARVGSELAVCMG